MDIYLNDVFNDTVQKIMIHQKLAWVAFFILML